MKVLAVALCLMCMRFIQAKAIYQVQLNHSEERCIAETGVDRELVIQDKTPGTPPAAPTDPLFNDYLYCYLKTLREVVVNKKDVFYPVPGYKTIYEEKSLWCKEEGDHISGFPIQCAYKFPAQLPIQN